MGVKEIVRTMALSTHIYQKQCGKFVEVSKVSDDDIVAIMFSGINSKFDQIVYVFDVRDWLNEWSGVEWSEPKLVKYSPCIAH